MVSYKAKIILSVKSMVIRTPILRFIVKNQVVFQKNAEKKQAGFGKIEKYK